MERDLGCQVYAYRFPTETRCDNKLIVHHRKPKGMGGSADPAINDMTNLVVLCDRHHTEVHRYPIISYECGLLIRR